MAMVGVECIAAKFKALARQDAGAAPPNSSCIMIILTSDDTEGRPVSITKCAVSRYKGSRMANRSRKRVKGSATWSSGRLTSWRRRRNTSSGVERKYTTWPRERSAWRLVGRKTVPPPVASTPGPFCVRVSMTSSSTSRKRASPSRSKNSRIEQPIRCSITWSESMKGTCKRLASCRPTVDLPEPGRPTKLTVSWDCCNSKPCQRDSIDLPESQFRQSNPKPKLRRHS